MSAGARRVLGLPGGDWGLLAAGALLVGLAYPPVHLLLPSFICLVPAVWLILAAERDPKPLRRRLAQGFWFGLLSNGLVLYWMAVALSRFRPVSVAGYAVAMLILAGYDAVLFAATGWITRAARRSIVIVFPTLWTALEWTLAHQGALRMPWLGLGTSLTGFPLLVQAADVIGARGITWLLAAANAALAVAWVERARPRRARRLAGAVALGAALATGYGALRQRTVPLRRLGRIALLQPGVSFAEKWTPGAQDAMVMGELALSTEAAAGPPPGLIVWPETAIPSPFRYHPGWDRQMDRHARTVGVPILVGGIDLDGNDRSIRYYNAAFLFTPSGGRHRQPVYRKHYLVPMVEHSPRVAGLRVAGRRWFGAFAAGTPAPVYRTAQGRFGVAICYEAAFEGLARAYRRRGADFLVNLSNDAWFGRTSAPYQNAAHLVMRAIENRIGVVRAANGGPSEFVDPFGRVHQRAALGVRTVVAGDLWTSDVMTIYTRLGDWVGMGAVLGTIVLVLLAAARPARR